MKELWYHLRLSLAVEILGWLARVAPPERDGLIIVKGVVNIGEELARSMEFQRKCPNSITVESCQHDLRTFNTAQEAVDDAIASASGIWREDVRDLFCGIQCSACKRFFLGVKDQPEVKQSPAD